MIKTKYIITAFLLLASVFVFASGGQEKKAESLSIIKEYTEAEKTELWESSVDSFSRLSENRPEILLAFSELSNSKYQTLLEQTAEVRQKVVDGELIRTISAVKSEEETGPREGAPGGGTEGRSGEKPQGGSGGRQGGSQGGGGTQGGSEPPQRDSDRGDAKDEYSFNSELAEDVVELWDQSVDIVNKLGDDLIMGSSTGDVQQIFNFSCMRFDFSDSNITGSVLIDTERGIPVKTIIENPADGNLKMEIFVLPGRGDDLKIPRMFYSTDVTSEDGETLLMKGSVTPEYAESDA